MNGALPGPAMAEPSSVPQVPEASHVPEPCDVARRQEMPRHEGGGPRGGWPVSMDWFKGKFAGNHGFPHEIWGFPL